MAYDKKLAEAIRAEIIKLVSEEQRGIVRRAVMAVDNPPFAPLGIKPERMNQGDAYFANLFDTIRFETAVRGADGGA